MLKIVCLRLFTQIGFVYNLSGPATGCRRVPYKHADGVRFPAGLLRRTDMIQNYILLVDCPICGYTIGTKKVTEVPTIKELKEFENNCIKSRTVCTCDIKRLPKLRLVPVED